MVGLLETPTKLDDLGVPLFQETTLTDLGNLVALNAEAWEVGPMGPTMELTNGSIEWRIPFLTLENWISQPEPSKVHYFLNYLDFLTYLSYLNGLGENPRFPAKIERECCYQHVSPAKSNCFFLPGCSWTFSVVARALQNSYAATTSTDCANVNPEGSRFKTEFKTSPISTTHPHWPVYRPQHLSKVEPSTWN